MDGRAAMPGWPAGATPSRIGGQRVTNAILAAATLSVGAFSVRYAGWVDRAFYAPADGGLPLGVALGKRIAAGASKLWAVLLAFAMGTGIRSKNAAESGRGLDGAPAAVLALSALYGAFIAACALLVARSERHQMPQAEAPPESPASSLHSRD